LVASSTRKADARQCQDVVLKGTQVLRPGEKFDQQLSAVTREGAIADGKLVEVLLDRALASMELLNEAADTMARLLDELLKG
jgi:hypothetical protein